MRDGQPTPRPRWIWTAIALLAGAAIGISIFGVLVWRAVDSEAVEPAEAARRFGAVLAALPSTRPLVELDDDGRVTRTATAIAGQPRPIARLRAIAWRAADRRLVSADTPFWFFRLKGPAARLALEGTGLDLERLQLTPGDLARFGPAIVVNHTSRDGSRLLVWTE